MLHLPPKTRRQLCTNSGWEDEHIVDYRVGRHPFFRLNNFYLALKCHLLTVIELERVGDLVSSPAFPQIRRNMSRVREGFALSAIRVHNSHWDACQSPTVGAVNSMHTTHCTSCAHLLSSKLHVFGCSARSGQHSDNKMLSSC